MLTIENGRCFGHNMSILVLEHRPVMSLFVLPSMYRLSPKTVTKVPAGVVIDGNDILLDC